MKQLSKRLTYANVMSSIAVFLVLGGATAFAAKKIGSNEIKGNSITTGKIKKEAVTTSKIKKNSISTAKIQNDAVTGEKVKESTLGEVPSAASAKNATNATNANNANTVGGQSATKIFAKLVPGQTNVQIASFAGFSIIATCDGSGDVENLLLRAPDTSPSVLEAEGNGNVGVIFDQDNGLGGVAVSLDAAANDNDRGETSFSGSTTTGTVVSGDIGYDDTETYNSENVCAFFGEVISG